MPNRDDGASPGDWVLYNAPDAYPPAGEAADMPADI